MSHGRYSLLAFGLVLAAPFTARADDAADARALVDKAVKAHGGADLAKFSAYTVRMKGTVQAMGQAVAFTGVVASHGPDRQKVDIEAEAGGQKFRFVNVLNGDKGWNRIGDETKAMDKDELAEAKEQAHAGWVATLVPLKDKAFTLATVGEIKVDGRAALSVKVSSKGRRDVDLYFDKVTGLLVKTETRVKDEGSGQEVTEETYPGEYKEVQGTKQAMKLTVKRDGKAYVEGEVTGYDLAEKLDADVFAKP
ncbi:MAG: hypothetical protein JWO38_3487 [Gemmataceae bacterium]|nr:hypothetical protein [Gemmataceae bacterium]